jgi:hypothetical protein
VTSLYPFSLHFFKRFVLRIEAQCLQTVAYLHTVHLTEHLTFIIFFLLKLIFCTFFRSVPPSQVVVAVSNTYGRVRKPIGFRLVHVLPGSLSFVDSSQSTVENECSIWIPVPPPGYSALGCVVNIGREPPSNHVVYCLRSDLVTSATFSDCIHTLSPAPGYGITKLLLFGL